MLTMRMVLLGKVLISALIAGVIIWTASELLNDPTYVPPYSYAEQTSSGVCGTTFVIHDLPEAVVDFYMKSMPGHGWRQVGSATWTYPETWSVRPKEGYAQAVGFQRDEYTAHISAERLKNKAPDTTEVTFRVTLTHGPNIDCAEGLDP